MRATGSLVFVAMFAGSCWSAPASASDFGCKVLLCLSNPGGPVQYLACVQPIEKLWSDLAQGKPFPTCSEDGVAETKTKGKRDSSSYRVIMTYRDGSQKSYSLAGISAAPVDGVPPAGGIEQP